MASELFPLFLHVILCSLDNAQDYVTGAQAQLELQLCSCDDLGTSTIRGHHNQQTLCSVAPRQLVVALCVALSLDKG